MLESPFRSPAGLFLPGGGALGAWQASVLSVFESRLGPAFGSVLGFSVGALNGAAYFLGRVDRALESWKRLDGGMLRFSPKLGPFSLFSNEPIKRLIAQIQEGDPVQSRRPCRFTVSSVCPARRRRVYARFGPGGEDGFLSEHLLATCAIPFIWPPVEAEAQGERRRLVDGGVSVEEPFSLDALGDCSDVLILSLVRPEEAGRRAWSPLCALDQAARTLLLRQLSEAVASLHRRPTPPRVRLLYPSKILDSRILDFSAAPVSRALALGAADAEAFLARPGDFLLS